MICEGCLRAVPEKVLEFEGLVIDSNDRKVFINGEDVFFTTKEFNLLFVLARNAGRSLSEKDITSVVWPDNMDYDIVIVSARQTMKVYITRLRKKLGKERIKTLVGYGYRFEG